MEKVQIKKFSDNEEQLGFSENVDFFRGLLQCIFQSQENLIEQNDQKIIDLIDFVYSQKINIKDSDFNVENYCNILLILNVLAQNYEFCNSKNFKSLCCELLHDFYQKLQTNFSSGQKLQSVFLNIYDIIIKINIKEKFVYSLILWGIQEIFDDSFYIQMSFDKVYQIMQRDQNQIQNELQISFFYSLVNHIIKNSYVLTLKQIGCILDIQYIFQDFDSNQCIFDKTKIQQIQTEEKIQYNKGYFSHYFSEDLCQNNIYQMKENSLNKNFDIIKNLLSSDNIVERINKKKILMNFLAKFSKYQNKTDQIASKNIQMLVLLTIQIFQNEKNFTAFEFDAVYKIFQSFIETGQDANSIVLAGRLLVLIYNISQKNKHWFAQFYDNFVYLLNDLKNLDFLCSFVYFYLKQDNEQQNIDQIDLFLQNIIIKAFRSNCKIGKRFLSFLFMELMGTQIYVRTLFEKIFDFLWQNFFEFAIDDMYFIQIFRKVFELILAKEQPNQKLLLNEQNLQEVQLSNEAQQKLIQKIEQLHFITRQVKTINKNQNFKLIEMDLFGKHQKLLHSIQLYNNIIFDIQFANKLFKILQKDYLKQDAIEYLTKMCEYYNYLIILNRSQTEYDQIQKIFFQDLKKCLSEKEISLTEYLLILEKCNHDKFYPYTSNKLIILLYQQFTKILKKLDFTCYANNDIVSLCNKLYDFFQKILSNKLNPKLKIICLKFFELFLTKFDKYDENGNFDDKKNHESLSLKYSVQLQSLYQQIIRDQKLMNQGIKYIIHQKYFMFQRMYKKDIVLFQNNHKLLCQALEKNNSLNKQSIIIFFYFVKILWLVREENTSQQSTELQKKVILQFQDKQFLVQYAQKYINFITQYFINTSVADNIKNNFIEQFETSELKNILMKTIIIFQDKANSSDKNTAFYLIVSEKEFIQKILKSLNLHFEYKFNSLVFLSFLQNVLKELDNKIYIFNYLYILTQHIIKSKENQLIPQIIKIISENIQFIEKEQQQLNVLKSFIIIFSQKIDKQYDDCLDELIYKFLSLCQKDQKGQNSEFLILRLLKNDKYTSQVIDLLKNQQNDEIVYKYFKYILEKQEFNNFCDFQKLMYLTQNLQDEKNKILIYQFILKNYSNDSFQQLTHKYSELRLNLDAIMYLFMIDKQIQKQDAKSMNIFLLLCKILEQDSKKFQLYVDINLSQCSEEFSKQALEKIYNLYPQIFKQISPNSKFKEQMEIIEKAKKKQNRFQRNDKKKLPQLKGFGIKKRQQQNNQLIFKIFFSSKFAHTNY